MGVIPVVKRCFFLQQRSQSVQRLQTPLLSLLQANSHFSDIPLDFREFVSLHFRFRTAVEQLWISLMSRKIRRRDLADTFNSGQFDLLALHAVETIDSPRYSTTSGVR